jgi:hypothetical protein
LNKFTQIWANLGVTLIATVFLTLTGCATSRTPPPEDVENVCAIFNEKEDWYQDVMDSERKWGTPAHVLMAIVRYESRFVDNARPPHKKFFGIIPMGRPSTAYGYCQAVNGTWDNYLEETGNNSAERVNFREAMDFIGWYTNMSYEKLGLSKWDGYNQYLAYHEGQIGYSRKSHNKKGWLLRVAQKVHNTAEVYAMQLRECRQDLELKQEERLAAKQKDSGFFQLQSPSETIQYLD